MQNVLTHSADSAAPLSPRPLIVITEGVFDINCLKQFSAIASSLHSELPDLQKLEAEGRAIFIPAGGGNMTAWVTRLVPLACPEFFIADREQEPETTVRQSVVDRINQRPGCRAVLTNKRSLENYLHPEAIASTFGITIDVTDNNSVAEHVARSLPQMSNLWPTLPRRQQHRLIYRTKRRLNSATAQRMTPRLLAERDPTGEVIGWFQAIASLIQ